MNPLIASPAEHLQTSGEAEAFMVGIQNIIMHALRTAHIGALFLKDTYLKFSRTYKNLEKNSGTERWSESHLENVKHMFSPSNWLDSEFETVTLNQW